MARFPLPLAIVAALATACGLGHPVYAQEPPLEEADGPTIGYPTVASALTALEANPKAKRSEQAGWTVFVEDDPFTIWSFAPRSSPAYPSAVKRLFTVEGGATYVNMAVSCESSKEACDALVREFQRLNSDMAAYAQGRH